MRPTALEYNNIFTLNNIYKIYHYALSARSKGVRRATITQRLPNLRHSKFRIPWKVTTIMMPDRAVSTTCLLLVLASFTKCYGVDFGHPSQSALRSSSSKNNISNRKNEKSTSTRHPSSGRILSIEDFGGASLSFLYICVSKNHIAKCL
jgi:hypothetical protein